MMDAVEQAKALVASETPDRISIKAVVKDGKHKGETVWIHWSPEGGGWWQWGPEGWAERFTSEDDDRFKDALRCAKGETWMERSVGPWFFYPDLETVEAVRVPAIVSVCIR